MTGPEVNAILISVARLEATMLAKFEALASENIRGEGVHVDHEHRLRSLEASNNESRGVWRLVTAGGALGALLAGAAALVARSLGV